MNIFALDSSGPCCSAAIMADGVLLAENFINNGLTHSETLMPIADGVFLAAGLCPSDIDCFAISCGPGSFTGLRIGMGAVKGMAFAADKPCVAVSSLEALAFGAFFAGAAVVPVADARQKRVYSAAFLRCDAGGPRRVLDDGIRDFSELYAALRGLPLPPLFVGDAAAVCYNELAALNPLPAPPHLCHLRASSVAAAAARQIEAGDTLTAEAVVPVYLQLSQAERELQRRDAAYVKGAPNGCACK